MFHGITLNISFYVIAQYQVDFYWILLPPLYPLLVKEGSRGGFPHDIEQIRFYYSIYKFEPAKDSITFVYPYLPYRFLLNCPPYCY